jgi:hypothetical protein
MDIAMTPRVRAQESGKRIRACETHSAGALLRNVMGCFV